MTTDLVYETTDFNFSGFNHITTVKSIVATAIKTTFSRGAEHNIFLGFKPVPYTQGIIIPSIIFLFIVLQNSIILKLYFNVKSDLALYIKVLAVFDIVTGAVTTACRLYEIINPSDTVAIFVLYCAIDVLASHTMLGPLFLALDRFLVVVFPHKFQLYEKKMRIFKVVLFACVSGSFVGWVFNDWNLVLMMVGINVMLHFVGCIVLYSIIVACILISARKMAAHRHTASNWYVYVFYVPYSLV